MAQPTVGDRNGGEAEIGLRLAAARWEEQKIDCGAVGMRALSEAVKVEKHERELEQAPARRIEFARRNSFLHSDALAGGGGDGAVGNGECLARCRVAGQACYPALDARARRLDIVKAGLCPVPARFGLSKEAFRLRTGPIGIGAGQGGQEST